MADRRLLLVFAHPDDETVFAAGVSSRYSEAGVRVGLCTATLGDRGKRGQPPICEPGELGRVRQAELVEAARIIGVSMLRVFGYPDRGLVSASVDLIRAQLVEAVRALRPQVVITFDPNGTNLHPDHVAVSRFTSEAVAAAADARWLPDLGAVHRVSRLLWTVPVRPWVLLRQGDPALAPGVDFVVDVAKWSERKIKALRAHRTQHMALDRIFLRQPDLPRLLSVEVFRQAWGPALPARPVQDLFGGIAIERP
ncbi:MAG: PIG-L deacetylase family protein [Acidobacteriota bacterium]